MRIFIAVLFSFYFSGLLYAQDSPWQLRQSDDNIPVYTRKVTGSPILEYKANVTVNAPLARVIALFEDEKQVTRWYYECVRSELVENEGPRKKIIYLVMHFPWPVAPRDFVFRRTRYDLADKSIVYSLTALPDMRAPVKGLIRVRSIKSLWTFKPLSPDQTQVFFQQHVDPAGSVPASLVNEMAVDTPFYSLQNLRRLLTKK